MGDRYFIQMRCRKCGHIEEDVYFAPTCGFTDWKCPKCGKKHDLYKETGISYEEASNRTEIEEMIRGIKKDGRKR